MRICRGRGFATAGLAVCAAGLGAAALAAERGNGDAPLVGKMTGRQGELRETVAIKRTKGAGERSVLSLALPRVREGDRIRLNTEVTVTTTCFEPDVRCIGRRYRFDPRLRVRVVLAEKRTARGRGTEQVSRTAALRCEQTRPNRNHHCPLVVSASHSVRELGDLPCRPGHCRLNVLLGAHHRRARGGEVVVVGADQPDGSVEGGKSRLSAAIVRRGAEVKRVERTTKRRLAKKLPASFNGGQRVVYSVRIPAPRPGDVILTEATQRTRIRDLPYFVAAKIIAGTSSRARVPGAAAARATSRQGTATETNGFNCTPGPSAFRSPCLTEKAGLLVVGRRPKDSEGNPLPLHVNLVSRTFPKLAQASRGSYPPAKVLRGGRLGVTLLRMPET